MTMLYAKFMAIPNYIYLKLKMLGPRDIIVVSGSFLTAYECDRAMVEHADNLIPLEELEQLQAAKKQAMLELHDMQGPLGQQPGSTQGGLPSTRKITTG